MWPQHPGQIRPLASDHHGLLIIPIHWLASSLSLLSTNKLVCGGRSGAIWLPSQKCFIKILFYKIKYNLISSVYLIDHIIWCKHNIHAVCIWIKTCTKTLETSVEIGMRRGLWFTNAHINSRAQSGCWKHLYVCAKLAAGAICRDVCIPWSGGGSEFREKRDLFRSPTEWTDLQRTSTH